jgi:hypothetical protein
MRFATLNISGRASPVVMAADGMGYCPVDTLLPGFGGDMTDLIARLADPERDLPPVATWTRLAGQRLLAPIPCPRRNILCVGKNYHEHAREFAQSGFDTSATKGEVAPTAPVVFTKAPSTVVGDGDAVLSFSAITEQLDYEAELAVVIGKPGRGDHAGGGARARLGLHHRQRHHRARPAAAPPAMVPRQVDGHVLPDGAVDRDRGGTGRSRDARCAVPRQRRVTPGR